MKTKIFTFLTVAFLTVFFNGYGQTTVTICPKNSQWWTGHVESNYDKNDDVIWVGKPTIGNACRGYAAFDITSTNPCGGAIPSNAIIQSIKLKLYPYNPGGSSHNLEVHQLGYFPVSAGGSTVWTDIADGTPFYDGNALAGIEDQWVTITLLSAANTDLQNKVLTGSTYWAVGLYEYLDNDNTPHIYGYSNTTYRPRIAVTYCTPPNAATVTGTTFPCQG